MSTFAVIRSKRERDYGLRRAEHQRITRQLEREREAIGSRALSAQLAEYACGHDAGDLAEVLAERMAGLRGWFQS